MSDMGLSKEEKLRKIVTEIEDLKELKGSSAYQRILIPHIQRRLKESLDGVTAIESSSEERSEHVRSYHLARELIDFVDYQIKQKEARVESLIKDASD